MKIETLLKIIAWERAYIQHHDPVTIIDLLQDLINTGEIQQMDEDYQAIANRLIDHGLCYRPQLRIVK